jgi:hypothetical protein
MAFAYGYGVNVDRAALAAKAADPLFVGGLGSFHAGSIAVAGMADGAIKQLTADIDPDVLRQFGHRADGEIPKSLEW